MTNAVPHKLVQLNVNITNALLTVLVISKSEPRYFQGHESNEYRGVINYTVRDSKRHIVNCKYWGSKERVAHYQEFLKIGDIIDIICPRVVTGAVTAAYGIGAASEQQQQQQHQHRFQPLPTLPITLVLNEGQSMLVKHNYNDTDVCRELWNLMRMSHKPLSSVLQLADVRSAFGVSDASNNHLAQFVELLVAVASIRSVKQVRSTRSGEMLSCLEVIVFDRSTPAGMVLSIWQPEWIQRAQQCWQAMKTILHLIEVRVAYSEFYRSSLLSFTGRTLVYENPFGQETQALAAFAATAPIKEIDVFAAGADNLPKPEQIITQMTVKQIYARAEGSLKDDTEQFTAVLNAMITKFDIDGLSSVVSKKCKSCQRLLTNAQVICDFEQCQLAFSLNHNGDKFDYLFNINTQFSDHTGTLTEARLSGVIAERLMDISVTNFLQLPDAQKEQLKWRFLLEYFEIKLLIKKVSAVRKNLAIVVIDMEPIDLQHIAQKIIVF